MKNGMFFQIELKGFGSFGNKKADEFLESNLNGYQKN
jgi:hypothetical protein